MKSLPNILTGSRLVMALFMFVAFFAKALLLSMNGIHSLGIPYGISIIVITVIIKLLFWPLTNASTKSMKRMAALQRIAIMEIAVFGNIGGKAPIGNERAERQQELRVDRYAAGIQRCDVWFRPHHGDAVIARVDGGVVQCTERRQGANFPCCVPCLQHLLALLAVEHGDAGLQVQLRGNLQPPLGHLQQPGRERHQRVGGGRRPVGDAGGELLDPEGAERGLELAQVEDAFVRDAPARAPVEHREVGRKAGGDVIGVLWARDQES